MNPSKLQFNAFPVKTQDKIRYRDTDRQGHVNNAVFSSFLETGRVEILYDEKHALASENCSFVIARLQIDFLAEVKWPGEVQIGTGVSKTGRSSIHLFQGLFQDNICVAMAKTIIVHVDNNSKKSSPLPKESLDTLAQWKMDHLEDFNA